MKLASKRKDGRTHSAFTLIDVIVAMGVLGIVLVSLFASFTFGFNIIRLSREEVQATQILHEKMEFIRLYNWTQINTPGFVPSTFEERMGEAPGFFKGTVSITNANIAESYNDRMRQVVVTVHWTNNNSLRSRSISTFVSQYGMQNYIYSID